MVECSFCGKEIKKGTGKIFIYDNGLQKFFCSNKCEKNSLKLRRDPRKFKWSKYYIKGGIKKKK